MNEAADVTNAGHAPAPRRRRWPVLVLLLFVAAYAAPWLIGVSGVANGVAAKALPWLPKGSNLGQASLGWMSPVHLSGIRVLDDAGRLLLECDHVTSQKSLWEMATSPRSPGAWTLEQPRLTLHVNPQGTSLAPVLRRLGGRHADRQSLVMSVEIVDGTISFVDLDEHPVASVDQTAGKLDLAADHARLDVTGKLTHDNSVGGVTIEGLWAAPENPAAAPRADLSISLDSLPLTLVAPWLYANTSIEAVEGAGRLQLQAGIVPEQAGPAEITADAAFTPAGGSFRRRGESVSSPVQPLRVTLAGEWDEGKDQVLVEEFRGVAGSMALAGSGIIAEPRRAGIVNFQLRADQDLSGVLDLLGSEVRTHVHVTGLRAKDVTITGALWPDESAGGRQAGALQMNGDVTWNAATFFGVEATPGVVNAAWSSDRLGLQPRDVSVGGGRLVALPHVRLAEEKRLVADQGPMLVNVDFTPEMCREWLKFVSPILADATAIQGKFTLSVESGQLPFTNPRAAEVAGTLQIHSARVTPGPLAREALVSVASLAQLVTQRSPAWDDADLGIDLPAQDVRFKLHDGRVYHQALVFKVGELSVTTRGSVGLDHTLQLLLEIPLPEAWLARGPILAALRGEVITIPVGGTLEHPEVDSQALGDFGKRIGAKAAGGLLQKLLDRRQEKAAEKDRRRRPLPTVP